MILEETIKYIENAYIEIAKLIAEITRLENRLADTEACNGRLVEQVEQLTAERDELKLAVAQTKLDISAWKNICTEWYKDAERFIQLANYNNKRAGEYFELHEQLVEKYKETK